MNKPVRVLELRGTHKGGGGPDKTILLSAARHDTSRVEIIIAYLKDPKDNEFQITSRARAMDLNYHEIADRQLIDWRCIISLKNLIKENSIHILHAHDDKSLLYGWILKKLCKNLTVIYTCHLLLDFERSDFETFFQYVNFVLRRRISVWLTKKFTLPVMAVSNFCKNQLLRENMKDDEVVVLHNGIDITAWHPEKGNGKLKKELGLSADQLLVGTVARIDPQKDFATFLEVADRLVKIIPEITFVIVGDGKGDELPKLKTQIKARGLQNRVHCTGHRNDLLDVYTSFDIFLMTSNNEGLPNTVLEAMALENPVVSTAVAGVPELVQDNVTGFICDIGDAACLTEKVAALASDAEKRQIFGKKGRDLVVERFSFDNRVKRLEDLYESYMRP